MESIRDAGPRWQSGSARAPSLALLTILFSLACTAADPPPEPLDCAAVGAWSTDGARVDTVEVIPVSEEQPAHCKVAGTIDTEVHFELVLPIHDAWNGRFGPKNPGRVGKKFPETAIPRDRFSVPELPR